MFVDIRAILDHYNISYQEKRNSDELDFLCPFHNDRSFGSAFFNETTAEYNCFSCKAGGNVYKFIMEMEECDFWAAKKLVESNFNEEVYDVDKLRVQFERTEKHLQNPPKSSKEASILVTKFLDAFVERKPPLDFIKKYYIVCVFLLYKGNINNNEFDKKYLQFYTHFFQELNSGVI